MHMAAIINDVPLLKRAIDVDNRGDLWEFNVEQPTVSELGLQSADDRVRLPFSSELRVFSAITRATHVYRGDGHTSEVLFCALFEIETCFTTRLCVEIRSI